MIRLMKVSSRQYFTTGGKTMEFGEATHFLCIARVKKESSMTREAAPCGGYQMSCEDLRCRAVCFSPESIAIGGRGQPSTQRLKQGGRRRGESKNFLLQIFYEINYGGIKMMKGGGSRRFE